MESGLGRQDEKWGVTEGGVFGEGKVILIPENSSDIKRDKILYHVKKEVYF